MRRALSYAYLSILQQSLSLSDAKLTKLSLVKKSYLLAVTRDLMDVGLIPPLGIEAGTEPCPAQRTVDHGQQEDVSTDGARGGCEDVPRPETMVSHPDNGTEAGAELCQAGKDKGRNSTSDIKDETDTGTERTKDQVMMRKGCKHDRKGYCSTHNCIAKRLSREVPCIVRNEAGVKIRSVKKKHYFECELGPKGVGVLRQTRLSFSGTSSTPSRTGGGHGRGGTSNFDFDFSSPTVGQHARGVRQTAQQTRERR